MRLNTILCTLIQGYLIHVLAATDGLADSLNLSFDHGTAPNTTTSEEDATNCTIAHTKHTETLTCIFRKPMTDVVNCARTQKRTNKWPPLRIHIAGIDNVTYVPESPESMHNIFIARDLYRNHKILSRRGFFEDEEKKIKGGYNRERKKQLVTMSFGVMLTVLLSFTILVAIFNTRTIFKMGASEKEDFLDTAVQRNDLIERLREIVRQKRRLQAELDKFRKEEDEDDDDLTLSPHRLSTTVN